MDHFMPAMTGFETVSRSLTQLERQGIIGLPAHRRSILLKNKRELERLGA